jgi:flagellum-specific peptidoglycan hydrolase FlgJ
MRRYFTVLSIISVVLLVASCRTKKPAVITRPGMVNASVQTYIEKYRDIAISEMKRTGVPASITLAQGMVESNYGQSRLATEAFNHFGIKCHNGWTGATIRHDDDHRNECFRRYRNAQESFYDHSDFLRTGSRYSFLFSLSPYDYKGWAHGLKKAGYATNPDYANMLIRKIEENNLALYDRGYVADNVPVRPPMDASALPITTALTNLISGQ